MKKYLTEGGEEASGNRGEAVSRREKALVEKKPKAGKKLPKEGGAAATDKKKKSVETYKIYIFKVLKKKKIHKVLCFLETGELSLKRSKASNNKDIMYYTLKASPYLHNWHSVLFLPLRSVPAQRVTTTTTTTTIATQLNLDKSEESEANNNYYNNNNNNNNNKLLQNRHHHAVLIQAPPSKPNLDQPLFAENNFTKLNGGFDSHNESRVDLFQGPAKVVMELGLDG
ncbi:hypothetical protein ACFE04_005802 [Oxalis oulophora]